MELRLESNQDHPRRLRGRDYDDVSWTHAGSVAHVEACTLRNHVIRVYSILGVMTVAFNVVLMIGDKKGDIPGLLIGPKKPDEDDNNVITSCYSNDSDSPHRRRARII